MRLLVSVTRAAPSNGESAGWRVELRPESAGQVPLHSHQMRALSVPDYPGWLFPMPPSDPPPPASPAASEALWYRLATGKGPEEVSEVYAALATRQPRPGYIAGFGRYLFECLLTTEGWRAVRDRAGEEPIELALWWSREESVLTRLPWEMLHDGKEFLSIHGQPEVAITRLVDGACPATAAVGAPLPRVLFVVGGELNNEAIQHGAEYLAVLRHIRGRGLHLGTDVLFDATSTRLHDAVRDYRPSVVHFICHGGIAAGGEPYLELHPEDGDDSHQRVTAPQLRSLLDPTGTGPPPVVVINACYSGGTPPRLEDRVTGPLAAELTVLGVPIVVGMWGEIVNRACLLFARRFYEALLTGKPMPLAAAKGRREGYEAGPDPVVSADWAFPMLFMAETTDSCVALDPHAVECAVRLEEIAALFGRDEQKKSPFCGRLELVEGEYRRLVACCRRPGRFADGRGATVLAVGTKKADYSNNDPRYGKTWLLDELAARAVRDGHVPCLLPIGEVSDRPSTREDFGRLLDEAIEQTRVRFGLETNADAGSNLTRLWKAVEVGSQAGLSPDLRRLADRYGFPAAGTPRSAVRPELIAGALRGDLCELLDGVRAKACPGGRPPGEIVGLLLVDDVNEFGRDALDLLLWKLLGDFGAGDKNHPIPAVLTFSGHPGNQEYTSSLRWLREFLDRGRGVEVPLGEFLAPSLDSIPYQQFLLGNRPPLVIQPDSAEKDRTTPFILDTLHEMTGGAPSRLASPDVGRLVDRARRHKLVVEAGLDELAGAGGGTGDREIRL